MPLLPTSTVLEATVTTVCAAAAATTTIPGQYDPGDVVCAWPVSGQYGPGSRILYYVLVAGSVLGRANPLLRGACLAAALLVPAVAALHAVVLAAVHVDAAVDMDIYGAFQICAIGVLAGPVTVKMSSTYFNAPARGLIFVWTPLLLAGLLSLIVEFFRANPTPCPQADFMYLPNGGSVCGLICDTTHGPTSLIRGGAQNNIYVIPSPNRLSFSTAILVCAACCIPAVLSLVSVWSKVLKERWKELFGNGDTDSEIEDRPISGTNAATPRRMTAVNLNIRFYLSMVEIPLFACAVIAILIIGEWNLWSAPVFFQQEPIASVGQWAPIVGTLLAVMGSLYAFWASGKFEEDDSKSQKDQQHCSHHCRCQENPSDTASSIVEMRQVNSPDEMDAFTEGSMLSPRHIPRNKSSDSATTPTSPYSPRHLKQTDTQTSAGVNSLRLQKSLSAGTSRRGDDDGNINSRHKVARLFETIGTKIGTPAPGAFDDAQFRKGLASNFPLVPGEQGRNEHWAKQQAVWDPEGVLEGSSAPLKRTRSRSGSFISDHSGILKEDVPSEPNTPVVEAGGSNTSAPEKPTLRRATLNVPQPESPRNPKQPRRSTVSITYPKDNNSSGAGTSVVEKATGLNISAASPRRNILQTPRNILLHNPEQSTRSSSSTPTSAQIPPASPTIHVSEHEETPNEAASEVQTPTAETSHGT